MEGTQEDIWDRGNVGGVMKGDWYIGWWNGCMGMFLYWS